MRRVVVQWFIGVISFTPALYCTGAPPNDLFTDRIPLAGLPVQTSGSNIGSAKQAGEPNFFADSGGFYATYQPVWWSWTSVTNAMVSVIVAMPDQPAIIGVFSGNSLSTLVQISTTVFHPPFRHDTTNIYLTEAQFSAVTGVSYAIAVDSQSVALGWEPSTNPDAVGYRLYFGGASRTYTNSIAIGTLWQDVMAELARSVTYYFVVTDFDSSGAESDFSNEVSLTVPQSPSDATRPFDLLVTTRPGIAIISPVAGTDFNPGADISLEVSATGNLGTSTRVEYSFHHEDGSLVEVPIAVAVEPFAFVWTNVAAGRYIVTATLVDDLGASTSSTVAITVGKPPNDNFADRLTLTGLPVSTTGYTVAAGTEPGEPLSTSGLPARHSAWWDWTAPTTGTNAVVVTMPNAYASLAIYTGTSLATLSNVDTITQQRSFQNSGISYYTSEARFLATEGTRYVIRVEGPDQPLILAITAPPAVALRTPAPQSDIATGSNIVLQVDASDSDGFISAVDYSYTTAAGSTFRIGLATNTPFSLPWHNSLSAGRYLLAAIAIDDLGAATISDPVPITVGRPGNDDFAARTALSGLPAVISASNIAAGKEPDEPDFIGDSYASGTVWFTWTAPSNGLCAVVVTMTELSPVVGVFTGTSVSTLAPVSGILEARYTQSNKVFYFTVEAQFNATAGTEYAIAVGSERQPGAPFNLAITAPPQVQIIAPLPDAEFAAGTDIRVELVVTDPDRTIARTEIVAVNSDDSSRNLFGVLSNASLVLVWTNAQAGRYVLTATVFDDVGASAVSAPVNFRIGRPPNDDFGARLLLTGSPAASAGSNVAADHEAGEPMSLGGYSSSRTVWWSWTAPSDGPKSVVVTMPGSDPLVGVFSGDSLSTLSEVSTLTAGDSWNTDGTNYHTAEARFNAVAGTVYSIAVDSKTGPGAPFTLAVTASPRIVISYPLSGTDFTPGDTILLAVTTSDDDGTVVRVDYYIDQPGTGLILSSAVTNQPFSLLWTNTAPGQYVVTARAIDDSGATAFADAVSVSVGQPPNDNFADRITLSGLPVVTSGSTLAASKEVGEPPKISDAPTTRTVWWSWTAPGTRADTVLVTAPNSKPLIAVYSGTTISNLIEISTLKSTDTTYSNGLFYYTREARFNATSGRVYAIAVDASDQPFTLAVTARPTVQIISPTPGTDFAPGSDILLQASAADLDGNINRVVYWFDAPSQSGIVIGQATNAPFSVLWRNPPSGPYSLSAKAVDDLGAVTVSTTPVAITVGRPANDNFDNRLILSGPFVNAFGSTLASGAQAGEPAIGGRLNSHSIWWSWSPPSRGPTMVLATMPSTRPSVAVFTGNSLPSLIQVSDLIFLDATFTNGNYYYTSEAPFLAVAGTIYSIVVDSGTGPPGPVELKIDFLGAPLEIASWTITNRAVVMQFGGNEGQRIIIEASSDLQNWHPVSTNIIDAGTISFSNPSGTNFMQRFFRAVLDSNQPPFAVSGWGLESDRFTLSTPNTDGAEIQIEASTNLQSWVPIATNAASGGVFMYSDVITTNSRQRFYRALRRQ